MYMVDVSFVCIELISVHCCFPDVICRVVRAVRVEGMICVLYELDEPEI